MKLSRKVVAELLRICISAAISILSTLGIIA